MFHNQKRKALCSVKFNKGKVQGSRHRNIKPCVVLNSTRGKFREVDTET
jgi:hypothetical protein